MAAVKISGQKGVLCEVQVLLSTILEKTGEHVQALKELEEAVAFAEEQGNLQLFLK